MRLLLTRLNEQFVLCIVAVHCISIEIARVSPQDVNVLQLAEERVGHLHLLRILEKYFVYSRRTFIIFFLGKM